jgi:hypothetical protein
MRIGVVISAVLALVVSLALLGSAANGGESRKKATLKLAGGAPLTLRGADFLANEKVRVTLSGKVTRGKQVTASPAGGFVVRFPVAYDRCTATIVRAVGAKGSLAGLKLPPLACPAPGAGL